MFQVHTVSPLDDLWEQRDKQIIQAAGRMSDYSGAGIGKRDHGWLVKNFDGAVEMKERLEEIPDVLVSIQEHVSYVKLPKR